ncbi:hypothetical protein [Gordonia sp. NPDC058843]|uniref:hypothetical protein n=1 Tax=Gordonia sp. NPDC058843 TaxID=3346648 RepID=UPI00367A3599
MTLDTAPSHRLSPSWLQTVSDALRGAAGVVITTAAFLVAVMVLVLAQIVVVATRAAGDLT